MAERRHGVPGKHNAAAFKEYFVTDRMKVIASAVEAVLCRLRGSHIGRGMVPGGALGLAFGGILTAWPAGERLSPPSRPLPVTAIVGATVINGTGAPPLVGATVLIRGTRIAAVGRDRSIRLPPGATVIDGQGLFVLPGFVDVNVHISQYQGGDTNTTGLDPRILRATREALRHGVTTLRDSYGVLKPLRMVRDSIRAGRILGSRLLFAGNVVGWGGPGSLTANGPSAPSSNSLLASSITQGTGEELLSLDADSLRIRINQYLDKGVDFVKYGGTTHMTPDLILFSDRAQRAMIEEVHKRGLVVETHAGSLEGLRMAINSGVDLVQHPEVVNGGGGGDVLIPDDLVQLFAKRRVMCALGGWVGGVRGENAKKLIRGGCTVVVATDVTYLPDWRGSYDSNKGFLLGAIRTLVKNLEMTPMAALVAATRNGALASRMSDQLGTVEVGKLADLVVLRADPLRDIDHLQQEQIAMVFKEGTLVDVAALNREAFYHRYADKVVNEIRDLSSAAAPTDAQWASFRQLERMHEARRYPLVDPLGRTADSAAGSQRMLQAFARQLGELRSMVSPAQQTGLDPQLRAWRQKYVQHGYLVEIPGVAP